MCVCAHARARERVCVCVCVRVRERERMHVFMCDFLLGELLVRRTWFGQFDKLYFVS